MTQDYYWTPEWQKGEREADADIKAGRTTLFTSSAELISYLKDANDHDAVLEEVKE